MSTHKYIDWICVAAVIGSLLLTILFMNGKRLGIQPVTQKEDGGFFTADVLEADWDRSKATEILLTGNGGTVKGNGAYVADGNVHIVYAGSYILSGDLADGSVIVDADGDDTIRLLLNGVSLHCEDDAALRIEQAGKVFVTLEEGTDNRLSGGETYGESVLKSGVDGVIYSRDDVTINGTGSLSVEAAYRHGIVCNDDLVITGGQIEISAAEDGIHANDSVRITKADLTIAAGDDGITVSNDEETDFLYLESGSVQVTSCYEGLEATGVMIRGGTIDIVPEDDGINAEEMIDISGGDIRIVNETGRDADGLDSNRNIVINGGRLFISVRGDGMSSTVDFGSENGGTCRVDGGTLVACGGIQMLEAIEEDSAQVFLMRAASGSAGSRLTLLSEDGAVLLDETIPCAFTAITLSTPELQLGDVCTLRVDEMEQTVTADNSFPEGSSMAGMFGGGMQRPERPDDMGELPDMNGFPGKGNRPNRGEQPQGMPNRNEDDRFQNVPPDGIFPGGEGFVPADLPDMGAWPVPGEPGEAEAFAQRGPMTQNAEDSGIDPISVAALVGASTLILLFGLAIAVKVKH